MADDVPQRLSADDRDLTLRRLQEAFAEGHLSGSEMETHLDVVLGAETPSDLAPVLAALPEPAAGRTQVLSGKSGRFRRRGAWRVPRVLRIESEFGKVDLDMTRAAFESPVTDIELQLRFGGAKITVPRDAVVTIDDLRTEWKQPTYKDPTPSEAGGPRIRITGSLEFGRLKVRHGRA
jgi:hypothetical protein